MGHHRGPGSRALAEWITPLPTLSRRGRGRIQSRPSRALRFIQPYCFWPVSFRCKFEQRTATGNQADQCTEVDFFPQRYSICTSTISQWPAVSPEFAASRRRSACGKSARSKPAECVQERTAGGILG